MSTWFLDLGGALVTFHIIIKCLTKSHFTVHLGCWFDSAVVVGEAEQQAGQAAGHVVSTIRKQRDLCVGIQLTFSSVPFHVIWDQAHRWCYPHSEWVYPPQANIWTRPSAETASKTHSQVCLPGGSNSSGAGNRDRSSRVTIHFPDSLLTKIWPSVLLTTLVVLHISVVSRSCHLLSHSSSQRDQQGRPPLDWICPPIPTS